MSYRARVKGATMPSLIVVEDDLADFVLSLVLAISNRKPTDPILSTETFSQACRRRAKSSKSR